MNIISKAALIFLSISVYGCGGKAGIKEEGGVNQYIASDFTNALAQIKDMAPIKTTLSMSVKKSPLGERLYKELRKKGYGMRVTKAGEGENHVLCDSDSFVRGGREKLVHKVTVGSLVLVREYEVEGGRVFPTSAMSITGGTPMYSKLNDKETFNYGTIPGQSLLSSGHTENSQDNSSDPPVFINNKASPDRECRTVSETHNVDLLGYSNYEELFKGYRGISEGIIAFNNDSIILAPDSDRILGNLLKQYNKYTDLISVLGISRGFTSIKNGNSELARARAIVLKKLLISKGVVESNVYDEAGWSGSNQNGKPARGVKVVVMRNSG